MSTGAGPADATGRVVLVVSPHYDDVPLSLGQSLRDGALAAASRVEVRVVFGRTNWSVFAHPTPRRAAAVTAWRRAEEALAARRFGYRARSEGLAEAILRTGDLDPDGILGEADTGSDPLLGVIEAMLWRWSTEADLLWLPAGVGRHVDHSLVAHAGERLLGAGAGAGSIGFYEERPYSSWLDDEQIAAEVAELGLMLQPVGVSGAISADTHRAVRRLYPSQMDEFFEQAQQRDRAGGRTERLWVPVGDRPRRVLRKVADG